MMLFAVMYGLCTVNSAADAAIDGALLVLQPSGANAFVTSGLRIVSGRTDPCRQDRRKVLRVSTEASMFQDVRAAH